jgi:hypothetical protein
MHYLPWVPESTHGHSLPLVWDPFSADRDSEGKLFGNDFGICLEFVGRCLNL